MPVPLLLLACAVCAVADPGADEARIEQLIHQASVPQVAAAARAPGRKAPPDPAAASIGRHVRVHTVDRGLYAGVLQRVDANAIVLRIELPAQALSYTLPRSGVAELEDVEPAP